MHSRALSFIFLLVLFLSPSIALCERPSNNPDRSTNSSVERHNNNHSNSDRDRHNNKDDEKDRHQSNGHISHNNHSSSLHNNHNYGAHSNYTINKQPPNRSKYEPRGRAHDYGYRHNPTIHYRRPIVRPVNTVVIEPPVEYTYSSVSNETTYSTSNYEPTIGSRLGFGLRILGNSVTDYKLYDGNIESVGMSPGVGWYIKYRPIRWISLELLNDFIFTTNNYNDSFTRIPLYFGIQTHFFDYGKTDLYFVAAIGTSFIRTEDYYGYYDDSRYFQWGGQFGLGFSIIIKPIEFGVDVRYTLESPPTDYFIDYDRSENVHGITFALSVGFSV